MSELVQTMGKSNWVRRLLLKFTSSSKHTGYDIRMQVSAVTSLVVQWLRLQALNARGSDRIPGQGTRLPCWSQRSCRLQ